MTLMIGSITFQEDGQAVVLTYMDIPGDIRNRGLLSMTHQVAVQRGQGGKDYGDEMDDLAAAAMALLKDALEDFASTEPYQPAARGADDDDEDDR